MFGLISLHFNDKIRKIMSWLHLKKHHYAKKKQKISQCVPVAVPFKFVMIASTLTVVALGF